MKVSTRKLQQNLKQRENDAKAERNLMARVAIWATRIREIKDKEVEMNKKLQAS